MSVTLHFHGAAGTVTGSCYRVVHPRGQFLVDCGMFQGNKTVRDLNYKPFPFDPKAIDFLLLTHAHIDHAGLLPRLDPARLPQAHLDDRADRRAARISAARTPPASRRARPSARRASAAAAPRSRSSRSTPWKMPTEALKLTQARRSTRSGSTPARACAPATGMPATSSARPRSKSRSTMATASPSASCSRAISARSMKVFCGGARRARRLRLHPQRIHLWRPRARGLHAQAAPAKR